MATPTIAQLRSKASTVDDLLYRAALVEMSAVKETMMSLVPRALIDSVNDSMGYQTIHAAVSEAAKVDADSFSDAADAVARAISPSLDSPFDGLESEINNIRDVVKPEMWDGEAARTYRSDHLNTYTDVAAQQMAALQELHAAMDGFHELLDSAYTNIDELLDSAKRALESIIDGGNGGQTESMLFARLTAVIGIAAAVGTGGTAMAFAIAEGAVAVAQAALTGGGNTTTDIAGNTRDSVNKLKERIDEFDTELAKALRDDIDLIDSRLNIRLGGRTKPIEIPRPAFADDPSIL